MFQKMLKEVYGILADSEVSLGRYHGYKHNEGLYLIMDANGVKEQEISELARIADHMQTTGDRNVSRVLADKEGKQICEWEGRKYCVLMNRAAPMPEKIRTGRKLAKFHARGRQIPFKVESMNRVGQWKQLWEKRLDQMEKVWSGKLYTEPENDFEKMFMESFPYYMGLSENAIQYLADTEIDDKPSKIDHGTVCHERFTNTVWRGTYFVKNPFEWVFDHGSRDLAEWVRDRYFANIQTSQPEIKNFLAEYQSMTVLSPFSWRLLYARLLFPLHYYETVENYYITQSEQTKRQLEDRLRKYLNQSSDHERFLSHFYHLSEAPVKAAKLPAVDWLLR
ncbi:spore coat putative kinase YutH [Mesobacillus selenatarsenatis]|uniref:Spore coat protein S n=1 Tax=Mesobacillus selenatarsenatis (strain DSM 18680 / JCM 14380 / FERM P-15431 / SF-1) TaxID=1321606 RepID=A0A0A8X335_MESS1|nr:spore coat protein YutH [Mesobacillus selenatarsenatis]GAM14380.1 spore coat protein S [Mesobacillus selenatarsenatis SF-1]